MTYVPSGSPTTGSDGLSATMRIEFQAIGTAFAALPRITTTGSFDTIFAQLGSFTFTLPGEPGTLALTADVATAVATETAARTAAVSAEAATRAAADTTNATAIATEATTRATAISAEAATRATADALAYNNIGRNLLHNPLFNVMQRGLGRFTGNGYTADRWLLSVILDTVNFSISPATDSNRTQIGDEAAANYLGGIFTGNSGTTANTYIEQRIESVQRLSGKTVTVSFWANASSALKLGVNMAQVFGTGRIAIR